MLRRTVLLGLLAGALIPASAQGAVVATHIGDFDNPTYVTSPPGDPSHIYVTELGGTIKVLDNGVEHTFLDISTEVAPRFDSDPEQGLLSIAFAPDFATSKKFFVYYSSNACSGADYTRGCDNRVSEFTATNADLASAGTEHVLLTMPHPNQVNHNGGQLQFGPDGDLYISTGDGGGSDDTEQNAQDKTNLLGKILRIAPGTTTYSIPAGNPFVGSECSGGPSGGSPCPEIWSYGLRNPWRFSFDSATGDLIIGDVGQNRDEEIDFAHPGQNVGGNYGWPCYEGLELNVHHVSPECDVLPSPVVSPVLAYHHSSNCSGAPFCGSGVIGGYVMHDPSLPSLNGCYVYGDLANSRLRVTRLGQPSATGDADLGPHVSNLSSFGVDASGHLWAADIGGAVYRLDSDGNAATTPSCPSSPAPPLPPGLNTGDKTPPVLKISRSKRQHVLKRHYVKITVVPNEVAVVTARATVSIPGAARVFRLHSTARQTLGGKRITLHMRISKKTLGKIRRALRYRKFLTAKITVTARDATGNRSKPKHTTVRLVR